MIEALLPDSVVTVESRAADDECATLHPDEEAVVARAVAKRRREFAAVRACARRAMVQLGLPPQPVLPGEHGAPRWPEGVLGSMTHCDGYRAAALARDTGLAALGIDAEPHRPLRDDGVLRTVALPAERDRLAALAVGRPDVCWDRLLFSVKESVYKAWFPLAGRWLGFDEAAVELHQDLGAAETAPQGRFRAELLVPGPLLGTRRIGQFEGRWTVRDGLVATALTVPRP